MKILFLDPHNGYEASNPEADLVELAEPIKLKILKTVEKTQTGVYNLGGNWSMLLKDCDVEYNVLKHGKESDFEPSEYDEKYLLISGNY